MRWQNQKFRDHKIIRGMVHDKEKAVHSAKRTSAKMFRLQENGEWVEHGCDMCGGGMSKRIYDFQRENRPQGTICSMCSKKEDKKSLKEL